MRAMDLQLILDAYFELYEDKRKPLRYFVWVVACKTSGRLKSNLPAIK